MKTSPEVAKALAAQIEEASALCSESLRIVRANENLGALQVYARLVGLFLGHSYTNILAPLWAEHPQLEPAAFKEPYEEPIPSLSQESQAAISAFLSAAKLALAQAESAFRPAGLVPLARLAASLKWSPRWLASKNSFFILAFEIQNLQRRMWPNPSIEATSQSPLRALCAAPHVKR